MKAEYLVKHPPVVASNESRDPLTNWLNDLAADRWVLKHITNQGWIFERVRYEARPIPALGRSNPERRGPWWKIWAT